MRAARALALLLVAALSGCSSLHETRAQDQPSAAPSTTVLQQGRASWYGLAFHGRKTASGEPFDMNALTAAHPTLPFGTLLVVRNPANGRSVTVRVNDRGPYSGDRIIDLSFAAARAIGIVGFGTKTVVLSLVPR